MKSKIQELIIKEFNSLLDWDEKYEEIIRIGRHMETLPNKFKTEENRVFGCQSRVWISAELNNNKLKLQADSDSMLVRGLVALVLRVYQGKTPQQIIDENIYFITSIGFQNHLTPSRVNGVYEVVKKIKSFAVANN